MPSVQSAIDCGLLDELSNRDNENSVLGPSQLIFLCKNIRMQQLLQQQLLTMAQPLQEYGNLV